MGRVGSAEHVLQSRPINVHLADTMQRTGIQLRWRKIDQRAIN